MDYTSEAMRENRREVRSHLRHGGRHHIFRMQRRAIGEGHLSPAQQRPQRNRAGPIHIAERGKKVKYAVSRNTREGLEHIVNLIESGVLKPVIDHVYPMDRIADAHLRVEGRHKRGSIIVTMAAAGA